MENMNWLKVEPLRSGEATVEFELGDERKSPRKPWAKLLEGVNSLLEGGYAFQGKFVRSGEAVPLPSVLAFVRAVGSWNHPQAYFHLVRLSPDGSPSLLWEGDVSTKEGMKKAVEESQRLLADVLPPSSSTTLPTIYLCNAISLQMFDLSRPYSLRVIPLTLEEARAFLRHRQKAVVNAVGHSDTDRLVREMLALPSLPEGERKSIQVREGDVLIVAQYVGPRLPEGATQLPPGARIEFIKVEVR